MKADYNYYMAEQVDVYLNRPVSQRLLAGCHNVELGASRMRCWNNNNTDPSRKLCRDPCEDTAYFE